MENNEIDITKLCRMCLEENPEYAHNIFEESLSNRIILLTGIDVQKNDALPKIICHTCRYQLEKSFFLRNKARSSDQRLRKFIRSRNQGKQTRILCKDFKDDDLEEYAEMFLESYQYFDEQQLQLDTLRTQFETEKQKTQEELTKLRAENEQYRARLPAAKRQRSDGPVILNKCASQFENSPVVLRRKRKDPDQDISEANISHETIEINEVAMNDFSQYELELISATSDDGTQQVFAIEHAPTPIKYEIIQKAEVTQEIVNDTDLSDVKKELIPCRKRSRTNQSSPLKSIRMKNAMTIDNEDENPENYFRIVDANQATSDENGEKKIFHCAFEKCCAQFSRRQACKTHFFNHVAPNRTFRCPICQKMFKVASALGRHERTHTKVKPWNCDKCGKSFSQKEMLKRHAAIHLPAEELPFSCNICSKKFKQKDPLRHHIDKVHSDGILANKFTCTMCSKTFAHSSGLSRHFLTHSGKTFTCQICDRVFNDKSALKRHEKIHNK